ncbi:MAG: hypothetical protein JAY90_12190 [Candidatus Thiodiazotropha lotti]|nr:hypothetical protein [Candidatus Thiodiazotropha lotti]
MTKNKSDSSKPPSRKGDFTRKTPPKTSTRKPFGDKAGGGDTTNSTGPRNPTKIKKQ